MRAGGRGAPGSLAVLGLSLTLTSCSEPDDRDRFGDGPLRHTVTAVNVSEATDLLTALSPDGSRVAFLVLGSPWVVGREGGRATALHHPDDPPTSYWALAWDSGSRRLAAWFWEGEVERRGLRVFAPETGGRVDLKEARELLGLGWMPGDGELFYASVEGDSTMFWRRPLDADQPVRLAAVPVPAARATLSSKGDRVAYTVTRGSDEGRGLWEIEPASGAVRRVLSDSLRPLQPTYSPDGNRISFLSTEEGRPVPWVVDRESAAALRLEIHAQEVDESPLTWTPEGDSVLVAADGRPRLVPASGNGEGRSIAFVAEHEVGRWSGLRRPEVPAPGASRQVLGIVTPDLAPGGDRVAFAALGDLWTMDLSGDRPRRLTDSGDAALRPRWSPDGERIAFFSVPPRGEGELRILDLTGDGAPVRIALHHPANLDLDLSWHPGGAGLAYVAWDAFSGRFVVGTADLRTDDVATLIEGQGLPPVLIGWSTDPEGVVYSQPEWNPFTLEYVHEIRRLDPGTGGVEAWDVPGLLALRSGWSPDLGRAAYSVASRGYWAQVSAPGDAVALPDPAPRDFSWSEDRRLLLYTTGSRLRLLDVEGGTVRTVPVDLPYQVPLQEAPILIRNVRIIDGTGTAPTDPRDVLVEGGRIASIDPPGVARGDGAEIVDGEGLTMLPGLINLHVHSGLGLPPSAVFPYFGTTTVRDAGTEARWLRSQAERIEAGRAVGPRLFFVGGMVERETGMGFVDRPAVDRDDVDTVRGLLGGLAELGIAAVKVRVPDTPLDRTVSEVARELGLPVTSHQVYPSTLSLGLEGKEHTAVYYREVLSSPYREDVLTLLEAAGTCVTSTLMAGAHALVLVGGTDPELRFPEGTLEEMEPFFSEAALGFVRRPIAPGRASELGERLRIDMENVVRMVRRGIPVAAATDAATLDPRLDLELGLFVEAGLTPLEAIRAATLDPARCMGIDHELGTVQEGKRADLILVRGDPSTDISHLRRIELVVLDGRLYRRDELLPEGGR